jgi:beta-galactosidase
MDDGQTWFWDRNSDGSILKRMFDSSYQKALGVAYPGTVVQQPRDANELTQTMFDLNAFSEEIVAFQSQKKPIRIFYSETSAINDES